MNANSNEINLQEFVRAALVSIVNGVSDARYECERGALIAPTFKHVTIGIQEAFSKTTPHLQMIEFDIAVTVSNSVLSEVNSKAEAALSSKGLIKVLAADLSVGGNSERKAHSTQQDSRISHIKFSVPILFRGDEYQMLDHVEKVSPPASK